MSSFRDQPEGGDEGDGHLHDVATTEEEEGGGRHHMSAMETTSPGYTDSGVQFAEDEEGGARVVKDGIMATSASGVSASSFTRFRRWRKLLLGSVVVLVLVILIAAVASGGGGSGPKGSWRLIDHELTQPDSVDGLIKREYEQFGSKVVFDAYYDRLAVAKQGATGFYGAVDVYSHWKGMDIQEDLTRWFHQFTHAVDHSQEDQGQPPPHYHQSVDQSEDGGKIVFNQGNHIHVFFLEGFSEKSWDPLGPTIELPAGHEPQTTVFGHDLAISGDGNYIAVMGYSSTASEKSFVVIYKYQFTRHGSDFIDEFILLKEITLGSYTGGTVSLDKFGKVLAVGEINGDAPERITVYERSIADETEWTESQVSTQVEGANGSVVDLSGDGDRLVFGTHEGKGNSFGVVQAKKVGGGLQWSLLGSVQKTSAVHRRLGASVAISMSGTRVAVGAPGNPDLTDSSLEEYKYGQVMLYEFDEVKQDWFQVLSPKKSEFAGDRMGMSVSIDERGDYVAAGAPDRNPFDARGSGVALSYHIEL